MDKISFRRGSPLKEIIHQGLKQKGYDLIYQDIVHHRVMIYRNRQSHTAMIFDAGPREESFTLIDYYNSADTRKVAQPFIEARDSEMRRVGEILLNIKSIL